MPTTTTQPVTTHFNQPVCNTNKTAIPISRRGLITADSHRFKTMSDSKQCEDTRPQHEETRTKTITSSTPTTSGSLHSQYLPSFSSVSVSSTGGKHSIEGQNLDQSPRTLRRRPRISDLQQFQSAPEVPCETSPQLKKRSLGKRTIDKRSVSASPSLSSEFTFRMPDRFTALRPLVSTSSSPLRTNHHPSTLEVRERISRYSNKYTSAFRTRSEGRRGRTVERPVPNGLRSFQPPHYTPSFVHRREPVLASTNTRLEHASVRRTSFGSVWRLSDRTASNGRLHGVELENGAITASGTNAPMIDSNFTSQESSEDHNERHERRLALALEIDIAQRVLPVCASSEYVRSVKHEHRQVQYQWKNGNWSLHYLAKAAANNKLLTPKPEKAVPTIAFRVLDAPRLKDDFYCSVLAYCRVFRTLAVALTHRVYLWTEKYGVRYPPLPPARQGDYVTCLAFSSDEGRRAILATSRHSGNVTLWSLLEQKARFEIPHPSSACSVAFRPTVSRRPSSDSHCAASLEDLLVGVDSGCIYFYSIDWSDHDSGSVSLLARVEAHSQNVCGLAWAPNGMSFVSGGNDNRAMLFHVSEIFRLQGLARSTTTAQSDLPHTECALLPANLAESSADVDEIFHDSMNVTEFERHTRGRSPSPVSHNSATLRPTPNVDMQQDRIRRLGNLIPRRAPPTPPHSPAVKSVAFANSLVGSNSIRITNAHKFSFYHSAAVKAIAFAPWQSTLLATSGGSNDRQIHFHHTETGTTLAVINVHAQVTSLVWSLTRREVVATFGYAQPEHEIRVAVFAWPSCECVVSIPWERKANGEVGRALWAIPYPGGPNSAAPERLQGTDEAYEYWGTPRTRSPRASAVASGSNGSSFPPTPDASPRRNSTSSGPTRVKNLTRGEGEIWASRTQEEGSLIIACCDQTVKFFEVWAGKSKGRYCGLGSKAGVFGGSKVLEGWCEDIAIEEVGSGEDVIQ